MAQLQADVASVRAEALEVRCAALEAVVAALLGIQCRIALHADPSAEVENLMAQLRKPAVGILESRFGGAHSETQDAIAAILSTAKATLQAA